MTVSDYIRSFLLTDYVDHTPAEIMTLNPGMFASTSEVPEHMYRSLASICGVVSGLTFERLIVGSKGEGKEPAAFYIAVRPNIYDNLLGRYSVRGDDPGEESSDTVIFIHSENPTYSHIAMRAELRIRQVMDALLRLKSGKPAGIPVIHESTHLLKGPRILCRWRQMDLPSGQELVSLYTVDYIRTAGKSILPG